MQMFWIAGGCSEITTLLSTGVQSIEFQLPTQSRQGSPSAFFGQQWIQFKGLMGPWGSIWFPSLEVRICLLSLLFYIVFIGKQVPNSAKGRGQVWEGERHLPPGNRTRLAWLLFLCT